MKTFLAKFGILFVLLAFVFLAMAQDDVPAPDLEAIVADYLDAWAAINGLEITLEDLKHYDSFFTSDISYELPKFDMVFQGEDFLGSELNITGLVRNSDYTIAEIIVGKGVVFLKSSNKSEQRRSEEDEWQNVSGSEFLVFEFEGDKIKRVIGY